MTDTQMDMVKNFVDTIDATTNVNHEGIIKIVAKTGAGNRILVKFPELVYSDVNLLRYIYRYKLEFEFDTEANLTTALNNLYTNVRMFKRRETITGYTRPSSLIEINIANVGSISKPNKYRLDVYIECEWSV